MKRHEIRLELAINADYPEGSSDCGYIWQLPLTDDYQVDRSSWDEHPDSFQVTRFWRDEPRSCGYMVRKSAGIWYLEYADGGQEPVFQLDREKLLPGELFDIRDHGNQMHVFRVVSVSCLATGIPGVDTKFHSDSHGGSARYYQVKLGIQETDYEAFLGSVYTFHLALTNAGHIDLEEWGKRSATWWVSYENTSGDTRTGDFFASSSIWYVHFNEPEESYGLIRQMEQLDLRVPSNHASPIMIRDFAGHWHCYKVLSCIPVGYK